MPPRGKRKWRRSDSNRRPPACKAGALPLSYAPAGDGVQQLHTSEQRGIVDTTPRRAAGPRRSLLYPSGASNSARRNSMVGQGGLEPPTPRLSSVCSNQLSYWPRTRGVAQSGEGCAVGAHRSPHGPQPGAPARSGRPVRKPGTFDERQVRTIANPIRGSSGTNECKASSLCQTSPKDPERPIRQTSLKGGDPAAGSPTATLLRLHPSR